MEQADLAFEPLRRRVLERLEAVSAALGATKAPAWADPSGSCTAALEEARRRLEDHIRFRFGRGLGAPAVVVLFGGTGVGKSTILNTLAGRPVTEVSVKRPCTTEPLVYHHRSAQASLEGADFLPAYTKKPATPGQPGAGTMGVELLAHDDDAMASFALVDAPDFDSVQKENRRVAEDLYRVADLLLFVVNPAKYADEETWKAIRRARADGKACAFVFNRAEPDDAALADFRALVSPERPKGVEGTEGAEVVELSRDPQAHAAGMLADPGARARLQGILKKFLLGDAADRLRLAELRRSWEAFSAQLAKHVLPDLGAAAATLKTGRAGAEAACAAAAKALVEEVRLDQSNDLDRVSRMVRENLFSAVGWLTKKVLGPLTALLDRATGALGRSLTGNRPAIENALARVHENNRQAVRKHFGLARDRVAKEISAPPGAALAETKEFQGAVLSAADVDARYDAGLKAFEEWKKKEFDALVGDIKTKKSAQLFVLQVVYIGVTVGTMAHTGGAIHLLEGLLAGPIIVTLDKMFVGAINWDLVRDLEKRGRDRFLTMFHELAREQRERWGKFFAKEEAAVAALPKLEEHLAALRADVPALLDALEKS